MRKRTIVTTVAGAIAATEHFRRRDRACRRRRR